MKKLYHIIALLIFSCHLYGQKSITLTLTKAIDIALERNTNVMIARNTLESQQSSVITAYGSLLPSLEISGGYSKQQSWSPITGGSLTLGGYAIPYTTGGFSERDNYNSSLSARVVLFNGFSNTANIRRATANAVAADYTLKRTEQSIIFQVHQLFLNVNRTYQLLRVSEDNLKRSKRQLERITEANKVGSVALADVYRQQVQVGNDELALIQSQNNYDKSIADLLVFLGLKETGEYQFDFSHIPAQIDTLEIEQLNDEYKDFEALFQKALNSRPDFKASKENLIGAEASVTMAYGNYYPTISASASYGLNHQKLNHLTDNRNFLISLNLSLPIFNGFQTQNQIVQARIMRENANLELEQQERQIRVELQKAILDLQAAKKQLMVTRTTVVSAEMDRKIAEEKYNLGAGTLLDLLIANANYTNAISNDVNAKINYLLTKKQLEYAIGIIDR